MSESEKVESADDFLRGQQDCENGVLPNIFGSDDYIRGYRAQYEKEQILTERSKL